MITIENVDQEVRALDNLIVTQEQAVQNSLYHPSLKQILDNHIFSYSLTYVSDDVYDFFLEMASFVNQNVDCGIADVHHGNLANVALEKNGIEIIIILFVGKCISRL